MIAPGRGSVSLRSLAIALGVVVATACPGEPARVAIGFASGVSQPHAGNVAQHYLDSVSAPGDPRIVIVTGDTGRRAESGANLLTEVDRAIRLSARTDIVAVVGPGGSREALQSAPIYREAGIPNVVPTATSRRLATVGRFTFVLAPNDSIQGNFIGAFAAAPLRARSALLFYVPDEYGLGLAAGVSAALARRNVALLGQVPVRPGKVCQPLRADNPYDDVVRAALLSGAPDVVVLATRTPEGACLARAAQRRMPGVRFLAGDGVLVEPLLIRMAGPAVDSIYVVAFWAPGETDARSRDFLRRFQALTGREPRSDDAMYFDATMLLAEAVRAAGPARGAVQRYLESLGRDRPPYLGVTGPIAFTPGAVRPLLMTRIRDGHPVPAQAR